MATLRRRVCRPKVDERLVDLLGQLARGRDDQGAHAAARALLETLKNGQRKGRRLAGAGLGQAHDVTPGHDGRDRLLLDRGGLDDSRARLRPRQRAG